MSISQSGDEKLLPMLANAHACGVSGSSVGAETAPSSSSLELGQADTEPALNVLFDPPTRAKVHEFLSTPIKVAAAGPARAHRRAASGGAALDRLFDEAEHDPSDPSSLSLVAGTPILAGAELQRSFFHRLDAYAERARGGSASSVLEGAPAGLPPAGPGGSGHGRPGHRRTGSY